MSTNILEILKENNISESELVEFIKKERSEKFNNIINSIKEVISCEEDKKELFEKLKEENLIKVVYEYEFKGNEKVESILKELNIRFEKKSGYYSCSIKSFKFNVSGMKKMRIYLGVRSEEIMNNSEVIEKYEFVSSKYGGCNSRELNENELKDVISDIISFI
jgi:hypothetical protein